MRDSFLKYEININFIKRVNVGVHSLENTSLSKLMKLNYYIYQPKYRRKYGLRIMHLNKIYTLKKKKKEVNLIASRLLLLSCLNSHVVSSPGDKLTPLLINLLRQQPV